ncbi:hypothetical protein [Gordoniibacillus kamchatkensis]|uniref:hypothetical protein n=1 Tax=Gordoniibacillus kamchatkensis TaxID=1590651 RepID=UPI0006982905|nr:hypothetical protein [Paenibacillus sp. VKM B-2647]
MDRLNAAKKNVKLQTIEKIALALHMSVFDLFSDEKEANLQQKKWLWASILLLLKHNDAKQRQAYRILRELLEPATEDL